MSLVTVFMQLPVYEISLGRESMQECGHVAGVVNRNHAWCSWRAIAESSALPSFSRYSSVTLSSAPNMRCCLASLRQSSSEIFHRSSAYEHDVAHRPSCSRAMDLTLTLTTDRRSGRHRPTAHRLRPAWPGDRTGSCRRTGQSRCCIAISRQWKVKSFRDPGAPAFGR